MLTNSLRRATSALDPFERFAEIKKTLLGGHRKDGKSSRYPESFAASHHDFPPGHR